MEPEKFAIGLRVKGKNLAGISIGGYGTPAWIVGATHVPGRFSKKTIQYAVVRQDPFSGMFVKSDPSEKPEYHVCKFEDLKEISK
ncbi:hypothetical protein GTY75_05230 [Streptomyces sp. SID8381]|uniref:hypothetical protein n=1 Tax=unclassified Streptomyces TaxID=2593676 RepID=UPI00037D00AA|nr:MULTISPECIES: hypothetical protein [unclassified Streptomyces]MYX26076.1 hypothetical protein [Streptomyces sp. SID8381]